MSKLILTSSPYREEFELVGTVSIGRAPGNTIQILDRMLSKAHARIDRMPEGSSVVRDLGSRNGTFVNGERIDARILLDGDEVALGGSVLRYVEERRAAAGEFISISPGPTETQIWQRLDTEASRRFQPAADLRDVDVLRRDYEKLRIAHELAAVIGAELDLDKLLAKILDSAFEIFRADRGAILLMDDAGTLVPSCARHRQGRRDDSIVLSNTVLNEVLSQKSAVLSSDAATDARFSSSVSIIAQGIRSTMTVPLLYGDRVLGVIHLDSLFAANEFTEKDLQVLTGLATQASIAIENARLAKKIEEEAQTRTNLQRLIPPSIVEQVVSGKLSIDRAGRLHEVTMLFSDIRGFTSMSEKHQPPEIVAMLNEYFELMVDILFRHQGTLDKFVGDAMIGLFGAPIDIDQAPLRSVVCALEMQRALTGFNERRALSGHEPIRIGIGINTGPVVTGAIGSSKALQYTAIGDAMNTAARLQAVAGPGQVILSESTMAAVEDRVDVERLPPVEVKGKRGRLAIYRVLGVRE